jgi:low affinity Fe/Cu permease
MSIRNRVEDAFALLAAKVAAATGSFWAFAFACAVVMVWAATGPLFDYSDKWQLVINTGTTIVTFLMVFVIQHAANKETRALQFKLNELIASSQGASNRLIDVEDLTDRELDHLYARFRSLARSAARLEPGAKTTVEVEDEDEDEGATESKPSTE